MSRCRSCQAEILWAVTENGRRVPLDAEPAERPSGLFRIEPQDVGGELRAISVAGQKVYLSHFVTCPNASEHRKSRA